MKNYRWHIGTRGETMIEVVLSLAVFALTMVMITVMLGTASRVFVKNYNKEVQFENQVNALNRDEVTAGSNLQDITFKCTGDERMKDFELKFQIELVKAKSQGNEVYLEKFSLVEPK